MSDHEYGLPRGEEELEGLARVLGPSFNRPPEMIRSRFGFVGEENLRVQRGESGVEAGLWVIPMGQWFGGRSVPMHGVAAVGVAPEARGAGAAARLMNHLMRDLHEQGVPLSGLYPATQTLYRRSGYELSGSRFQIELNLRENPPRERSSPVRPFGEEEHDAVKEVYREAAQGRDGHLDRGPYVWDRVFRTPDGAPVHTYLVEENGRPAGYLAMTQTSHDYGYNLHLRDLVATTPAAGRRLLSFLADHRSMSWKATFSGGPHTPLLLPIAERAYEVQLASYWMTRIVDVKAALEGRGYSAGIHTEVSFELTDDVIPANNGRFVLAVEDGRGRVEKGGNGKLRLHIRALAPLYTGFLSPRQLRDAGWLEGDEAEGDRATGVFGGATPWMPDHY